MLYLLGTCGSIYVGVKWKQNVERGFPRLKMDQLVSLVSCVDNGALMKSNSELILYLLGGGSIQMVTECEEGYSPSEDGLSCVVGE